MPTPNPAKDKAAGAVMKFRNYLQLLFALILFAICGYAQAKDAVLGPSLPSSRIISLIKSDPQMMSRLRDEYASRAAVIGIDYDESTTDSEFMTGIGKDRAMRARVTSILLDLGYVDPNDSELTNMSSTEPSQTESQNSDEIDGVGSRARLKGKRSGLEADDELPALKGRKQNLADITEDSTSVPDEISETAGQIGMDSSSLGSGRAKRKRSDLPDPSDVTKNAQNSRTIRDRDKENPPESIYKKRVAPYQSLPSLADLYTQTYDRTQTLKRFGADLFQRSTELEKGQLDGPVGADYVVGSGDVLDLSTAGSVSRKARVTVDHEGRIFLPEIGNVLVAGKSMAEARVLLQESFSTQFKNISVDIALAKIRRVRVYVVGEVSRPGAYDISGASTVLNALYAAGGPTPRGSVRRIRHLRGARRLEEIDLYDLLTKGVQSALGHIESGDTLLVTPIGPQVGVSGAVRRPAIYELKDETDLSSVVDLAGGFQVSASLENITVDRVVPHDGRVTLTVKLPDGRQPDNVAKALVQFSVLDGDQIVVAALAAYSSRSVFLDGHVTRPGKYAFVDSMNVRALLRDYRDMLPEPSNHAELVRLAPPDLHPEVVTFDLRRVMSGDQVITLRPFDTVRIFGRYDVDAPTVAVYGEVLRPGKYPMTEGMNAADLVRLAGGFKRSAYVISADLASYEVESGERVEIDHREIAISKALAGQADSDVRLHPGDVLTIRQLSGWQNIGSAVTVSGEVMHPGKYGLEIGERLSSVLKRAGGFSPEAFPAGAVLIREQVKEMDRASRDALIRRIEATQPVSGGNATEAAALATAFSQQQQQILKRLRDTPPSGRQVIHIAADVNRWAKTSADIELRAGDQLIVPKRPNFVLLSGQVNSPSAITFTPGRNVSWYIRKAGGVTDFGNKKGVFVVRSDGTVLSGRSSASFFSGGIMSATLQPGDSIVIPEKIISDNAVWRNVLNVAQITSSMAIAARVATSF